MKKETIEEAAERIYPTPNPYVMGIDIGNMGRREGFKEGVKWQQERMYIDMQEYAEFCIRCNAKKLPCIIAKDWFEQFKNETK